MARKKIDIPRGGPTEIVSTPWQARFGLGNPKNVGECLIYLIAVVGNQGDDGPGNHTTFLYPGRSMFSVPPAPRRHQDRSKK